MTIISDDSSLQEFVDGLIENEIGTETFNSYDTDVKRKVQCIILVKEVIREGLAQGLDAVEAAVRVCKQTEVGAGWLLNQKISTLLARVLRPTAHRNANNSEDIIIGCDIILEEVRQYGSR